MGNIHTTGPNQVMAVSGGCFGAKKTRYIIGGWAWAWWCVSEVNYLSLEVMTLNPRCDDVETAMGVPLTVTGVAQVKVMSESSLVEAAAEQFLGRKETEIKQILLQTLDGHLRAILGTMTVEAVYQDREKFAELVRQVASPDLGRMGMEILSFTIKDVEDNVRYLDSLGKTQTANVKRDADIGVAQANRDAGIKEAEAQRQAMDTRYAVDTTIANYKREFELKGAQFTTTVNTKKAEAELAYQLQSARLNQAIRQEEIQIDVVERHKQIDVEEKEIQRKEKELYGTVRLPAEAEASRVQCIAEGQKTKMILESSAAAERTKLIGAAQAYRLEATGKAEAERMRLKAAAYRQYGDAAVAQLVLEALPKIASEIAAPLSKTKEIVVIGGDDRVTSEVSKLAGALPPSVQALTGIDLTKVIKQAIEVNSSDSRSSQF